MVLKWKYNIKHHLMTLKRIHFGFWKFAYQNCWRHSPLLLKIKWFFLCHNNTFTTTVITFRETILKTAIKWVYKFRLMLEMVPINKKKVSHFAAQLILSFYFGKDLWNITDFFLKFENGFNFLSKYSTKWQSST